MIGEVLILGAGKTGLAVLEYVASTAPQTISSFTLVGGKESISVNRLFPTEVEGRIALGTDTVPNPLMGEKYDVAIVSPGISPASDLYKAAQAKTKRIISEVEFAFLEMSEKWIGITGTNGKTTTTTLVSELLNKLGLDAVAAGNIGLPLIEVAGTYKPRLNSIDVIQKRLNKETHYVFNGTDYEVDTHKITVDPKTELPWIVAELSSYQLHNTFDFHPSIACLLNITPDHLAWHGSFENYKRDKARIFQNLTDTDFCVVGTDTPDSLAVAQKLRSEKKRVCYVSVDPEKYGALKEWDSLEYRAYLTADKRLRVDFAGTAYDLGLDSQLPLKGDHNVQNILAAASIVIAAASDSIKDLAEPLKRALQSCTPLPHRIEEVAKIHDVAFINDSKATNFDSTLVALRALQPQKCVLLLGGKDKGIELDKTLVSQIKSDCIAVVCFGEAGPRIAADLEIALDTEASTTKTVKKADLSKKSLGVAPLLKIQQTMEDATVLAHSIALKYDDPSSVAVLLSPGCSSFDEFSSFEERGTAFKGIVERMKQRAE